MKEIEELLKKQRSFFEKNQTKSLEFRIRMLGRLAAGMKRYEKEFQLALYEDLGKVPSESYMSEIALLNMELKHVVRNLKKWMKKRRVKTDITVMPGSGYVIPEPYGVVLVMAPWNYPMLLSLAPVIDAIAAGNCVVMKPSSYAPATTGVLKRMINHCFPSYFVEVVEGGREVNQMLLEYRYDSIFFTGGKEVGRIVLEKAARYFTPVTLELGGKSPCIVDPTADLKTAARRIAFGKLLNSGQTCVAPDYVLVHSAVKDRFLAFLAMEIKDMLKENKKCGMKIINERHFDRLIHLMNSGTVYSGGEADRKELRIEPAILINVKSKDPAMQEEIFGPVLPVIGYRNRSEIKAILSRYEKPLAFYLFTKDKRMENWALHNFSFGGGCINNTILQITSPFLPFGGVGESGMGCYHGKYGFDTFSHFKGIIKSAGKPDISVRYQPYSKEKDKMIRYCTHM